VRSLPTVRRLVRVVRPRHIVCVGVETEEHLRRLFRRHRKEFPAARGETRGFPVRTWSTQLTKRSRKLFVHRIRHTSSWGATKADRRFIAGYLAVVSTKGSAVAGPQNGTRTMCISHRDDLL
jgi:hypothetical protein